MSYQLFKQDVLFYQRLLKSAGLYPYELDGVWGSLTDKADADFAAKTNAITNEYGAFDARSESNIITLMPKAQIEARKFLKLCKASGKDVRIISGTRTYAEQNELYAHGRKLAGHIITNAKGGQSNHNFGIAWDIGIFINGSYSQHSQDYISLAATILSQLHSIEWGGDWHSLKDYPHYQLKAVNDSVAIIRGLFESGQGYV